MLHHAQNRPALPSSNVQIPDPSHHPKHAHTLPENYDDQVAFLYNRIEDLKQLFEQFIDGHKEMKVFRDLRPPLGRLVVSPNVVRVTLDEFCKAVKYDCPTLSFIQHYSKDSSLIEISSLRSPRPSRDTLMIGERNLLFLQFSHIMSTESGQVHP